MKRFYLFFLLIPVLFFSQGENDNWYFGYYDAVNFSGSVPLLLTNSAMSQSIHSSGTVSDSNGNLLFYTSGREVFDRSHQLMTNGTIDQEGFQLAIVKNPGNSDQYYIITTGVDVGTVARYSLVDMSLGGIGSNGQPLGAVLPNYTKVPILDGSFNEILNARGVTIVPHGDGSSYWILIVSGFRMYAYHLSGTGLNPIPIISDFSFAPFYTVYNGISIKASPQLDACNNFSHYLSITYANSNSGENGSFVKSFNNSNGQFTADYELSIASIKPLYTEFNQNAKILYIGRQGQGVSLNSTLYAVDLSNSYNGNVTYNNINFSQIDAPNAYGINTIQRNKNGDIYFNKMYGNFLCKIINPDVYGQSSVDLQNLGIINIFVGSTNNLPQLVPTLIQNPALFCLSTINLNSTELNAIHTYHAANNIITENNYSVETGQNIVMKAGINIELLPNTFINNGANYVAEIEDCNECFETAKSNLLKQNKMYLDLDRKIMYDKGLQTDIKEITVYPNPANDILNINSKEKIKSIVIYDLSGKRLKTPRPTNKVDVSTLPVGTYLINVETKDGISTEKFIKK